jgi:hypothetical protein
MTGDGHMRHLENWLGDRAFPQRIWSLQASDAIRVVQAIIYRVYFCSAQTAEGTDHASDAHKTDGADDADEIERPEDWAGFRDVVVHRHGPSALPDHEWVTSGCFSYRAPAAFLDPRDTLAQEAGPARMAIPLSLTRLGWRHYYGTSLPSRVFPPVARLYLGVPARSRREYWNALWPMLSDAVPVLEAKVLTAAHLTRNDSVVIYLPVEAACLADALACESLARVAADLTRPPLTLRMPSGAGLAESPPGESFGQRRARQIARCYVAAKGDVRSTVDAFADELGLDGATCERPWKCSRDFDAWLVRSGVRC